MALCPPHNGPTYGFFCISSKFFSCKVESTRTASCSICSAVSSDRMIHSFHCLDQTELAKLMTSAIRKFIFHDLQTIEGYIDPPDALVFLSLLQGQKDRSLGGAIAEIGVFYGRSYFLLRKISGIDEKILAIDLFNLGQTADGVARSMAVFWKTDVGSACQWTKSWSSKATAQCWSRPN